MITETRVKLRKGFAVMSEQRRRDIARRGGLTIGRNLKHMREIGSRGGLEMHRRYKLVRRAHNRKEMQ